MSTNAPVRIGIVTVSDRASKGVYQDLGGPAIRDCLTEILSCPWEPVGRVIPDERPLIEATLQELCDREGCCDRRGEKSQPDLQIAGPNCRSGCYLLEFGPHRLRTWGSPNHQVQQRGRRERLHASESRHAGPVCGNGWGADEPTTAAMLPIACASSKDRAWKGLARSLECLSPASGLGWPPLELGQTMILIKTAGRFPLTGPAG